MMEWMIFLYPEGYEKTVLNSDDQQNEQPPKSLITKKRPQHIMLEIQTLGLDRHKNVVQLNQLMGPPPLDDCIFNGNTNINKPSPS